jgi:acyl-homoserine lactone acylase PvdQ
MKPFEQKLAEAIARLEADLGNPEAWPPPAAIHLEMLKDLGSSADPLELAEIPALGEISNAAAHQQLVRLAGILALYEFPVRLIRVATARRGTRTYVYSLKRHTPTT